MIKILPMRMDLYKHENEEIILVKEFQPIGNENRGGTVNGNVQFRKNAFLLMSNFANSIFLE